MWKEAAQITLVCVLAIQMGLVDAIGKLIRYEFRILSCPKCSVLWCSLGWHLIQGRALLDAVFVSFLSSYSALWLSLAYDYIATKYNKAYEKITDTPEAQPGADEVS